MEIARRIGFPDVANLLRLFRHPVFVETAGRGWILDPATGEAIDPEGREATADLATTPRIVRELERTSREASSSLLARAARLAARDRDVDVHELVRIVFDDERRADDMMTALEEEPRDVAAALDALAEGATGSAERRRLARHGATAAAKALEHGDVPSHWFEIVDAETALRTLDEAAADGARSETIATVFEQRQDLAKEIELPDGDGVDALALAAADVSDDVVDAVLEANSGRLLRDSAAIVRRLRRDADGNMLVARLADAAERRHLDALATALEAETETAETGQEDEEEV